MLLLAILLKKTYIGFRFVLGIKSYVITVPIDTHTHTGLTQSYTLGKKTTIQEPKSPTAVFYHLRHRSGTRQRPKKKKSHKRGQHGKWSQP